jgi:hypothetical protein
MADRIVFVLHQPQETLIEKHRLSGLSLKQVERLTGEKRQRVNAQQLCSYMHGKGLLRSEKVAVAEQVLDEALLDRAKRIAALLGRETPASARVGA